jgi:hypothetical protein
VNPVWHGFWFQCGRLLWYSGLCEYSIDFYLAVLSTALGAPSVFPRSRRELTTIIKIVLEQIEIGYWIQINFENRYSAV